MAVIPCDIPEARRGPSGSPPAAAVASEGCCCGATAAQESALSDIGAAPCCCLEKPQGPPSPETLCYRRAPQLPDWLHADAATGAAAGAPAGSCREGGSQHTPLNWLSASSTSPATAAGWRSPPMCCSTAVSPSSRCEQVSCCGSPASRCGECCCLCNLQLQQLRCTDTPVLQLATPAGPAAASPPVAHARPSAEKQKGRRGGDTLTEKTAAAPSSPAAAAAAAADEAQMENPTASSRRCSAAEDTREAACARERQAEWPCGAEAPRDAAAALEEPVLPPPAAEAVPHDTQVSPNFSSSPEKLSEETAAAAAEAAEGDVEGWISVKPRRQRRSANAAVFEEEEVVLRELRKPHGPGAAGAARQQQRHPGPAAARQRKPCSGGDKSSAAASHRQQHHPCLFSAAVAAGLVAPSRDIFVAPSGQQQQIAAEEHWASKAATSSSNSSNSSNSNSSSSNSSSSNSSPASLRSWCLWHDACGAEASGSSKGSSSHSKGKLQEEYERGLVQVGRAGSLRGIMQLWGFLTSKALGPPVNLAVAVGGCTPLWEDPQNRRGGHFAIRNLAGRSQAMDLFFVLLRALEQPQQRIRRPVGALLSSLTAVVLCLRNNDRNHKVEVWVSSTAPQAVRLQEVQLRSLLCCTSSAPSRMDVGFLSHEACLHKNQRKLRLKPQRRELEGQAVSPEQQQRSKAQLPLQQQQQQQQQQQEPSKGVELSFLSGDEAAAAAAAEDCPPRDSLLAFSHELAPSIGSVSTDTGSSRRSSSRIGGSSERRSSDCGDFLCDAGPPHRSYKSVILRGSNSEEQHLRCSALTVASTTSATTTSSNSSSSSRAAEVEAEAKKKGLKDSIDLQAQHNRQQLLLQRKPAGSNRGSSKPPAAQGSEPAAACRRPAAAGGSWKSGSCADEGKAAEPVAAAGAAVRGPKGGPKGGFAAVECGLRGRRQQGRQKQQKRQYGGSHGDGRLWPEQRLLQHLYAFDARELPDYFSMEQAAYQGRAAMYASYAACASAAVSADAATPAAEKDQGESFWDFPPLALAAAGRNLSQKQKQQQQQIPESSSSSQEDGEVSSLKCGKRFSFNPNAPNFLMPSRAFSALRVDRLEIPCAAAATAVSSSSVDEGSSECSSAATGDSCSELLLQTGPYTDVGCMRFGSTPNGDESVQAAVAAAAAEAAAAAAEAEAAAAAEYMGGLFNADFVDPSDPSSLLLITLMLHPALNDAAPLQVPLLPLVKLEGDTETADSSSAGAAASADPPLPEGSHSRLSLTLDYEEGTQTLSLNIVQS